MSFLVEPALSALFEALLQKLGSQDFLNFTRRHKVEAEIRRWTTMLRTLRAVLGDAEQKRLARQDVQDWLGDLQHLAYDVEDVLDEFSYDILRREVLNAKNQSENRSCTSMVRGLTPDFISGYSPKSLLFNSKMASKFEKITTRLQEITNGISTLNLLESFRVGASSTVSSRPPIKKSSSVPDEPVFIGRDEEKRRIIELLMRRHEQGDARIGVIPITGMGGLGKTSLARSVFNDNAVKGFFEKLIWVSVSQDYDATRITRGILEAVTHQSCNDTEFISIQAKLHEAVSGKRFLLVLDDLWNEDYGDWNALRSPWMYGAPGSKVIVTTRHTEVANMTQTVAYEPLRHMSDDNCWSIFCSHAFDLNGNSPNNSRFEEIGRKIVRKCSGLPLLAMNLGGLLRSKEREEDWESVLNNKSWIFKDGKVDVISVLRMSYYDLPSHLKSCFAYCAIFPEDFEFEEDKLVYLWMAEGLIQSNHSGEDETNMEVLGHSYFHNLLSRSFFLPANRNKSGYVIHDLVRDLAEQVAGETCYRVEKDADSPNHAIIERARHITFVRGSLRSFGFLGKMQVIRSILPLPLEDYGNTLLLPQNTITVLLSKTRYLRVLSFHGYKISELPEIVGSLKHLRYLDLSQTNIKTLPISTTSLYNLHTLMLRRCRELKKLPRDIWKLINLYHLDIADTGLDELPPGIAELKNVGRLSDFIVGKGHDAGLTSLKNLKLLRGELRISKLENVSSAEDARSTALRDKNKLEGLFLEWSHGEPSNETAHGGVLEELQPHKDLKRLTIWNYRGASLPSWMVKLTLLCEIVIDNCPKMSGSLPLAMTSLKRLSVSDCPLLVVKLPSSPELTELCISGCKEVDCVEDTNFDSLNQLILSNIENVTSLVREKVLEGMKHVKSLLLFGAHTPQIFTYISVYPLCKLENLPFVTSLVMDEDGGQTDHVFGLIKVEHLYMTGYESLVKLPQWLFNGLPSQQTLSDSGHFPGTLTSVEINSCRDLISIPPLPIRLEKLAVRNCPSLKKLPNGLHDIISLRELTVYDCQGVDSLPEGGLPANLEYLRISNTNILKLLLEWGLHRLPRLRILDIARMSDVVSLPPEEIGMRLPQSLTYLRIDNFPDLECLTSEGLQELGSLETLTVSNCPKLATLPDGGHPPSLQQLHIYDCPLLKQNRLSTGWSSIPRMCSISLFALFFFFMVSNDWPAIDSSARKWFSLHDNCLHNRKMQTVNLGM